MEWSVRVTKIGPLFRTVSTLRLDLRAFHASVPRRCWRACGRPSPPLSPRFRATPAPPAPPSPLPTGTPSVNWRTLRQLGNPSSTGQPSVSWVNPPSTGEPTANWANLPLTGKPIVNWRRAGHAPRRIVNWRVHQCPPRRVDISWRGTRRRRCRPPRPEPVRPHIYIHRHIRPPPARDPSPASSEYPNICPCASRPSRLPTSRLLRYGP
jgi:hypothetical protein